jgi:hypothetical protein
MFFLNLGLGEFVALLSGISAIVFALYLLDRSKRKLTVATLRFWKPSEQPTQIPQRRRIQQPISLLLQLLSMALLLLAIAQLRIGSREEVSRDHVLILDTSSWMSARINGASGGRVRTLMDEARSSALAYVRTVAPSDRIMLVRADGVPTPATVFEKDRKLLERAIRESTPGFSALHLNQAIDFARQAEKLYARRAGEVVFVGAGKVASEEGSAGLATVPNFRAVLSKQEINNVGFRKVGLRRSVADPALWEILVTVRNFGQRPATAPIALQFGGAPAGSRKLMLKAGEEQEARFEYRTRAAGLLEARLLSGDAFPGDDRAIVELPALTPLKAVVYSDQPEALRPILTSNPLVEAEFRTPAQYDPSPAAAIMILDRMRPPRPPAISSIWIRPPVDASPVPVKETVASAKLVRWASDHALGSGLRTRDLVFESTEFFRPRPDDVIVAEVEQGPAIVARGGTMKTVVLGFHPLDSAMKFDLTTPLLFANILRWMSPDVFRHWEVSAGSAGTVVVPLAAGIDPNTMRVSGEDNRQIPFSTAGNSLRFFAGTPGTVRISGAGSDLIYSTALPEVPGATLELPAGTREGIPSRSDSLSFSQDVWQWLALLGGLGLLIEWLIYGASRRLAEPRAIRTTPRDAGPVRRAS